MAHTLNYICATIFITFLLVEFIIDRKEHRHLYQRKDSLHSILLGAGIFLTGFANRFVIIAVYYFIYSFRVFTIANTWITWIILLLLTDFAYYWYHRTAHSVNWFWASHSVHHSSEHFNIAVSLRHSCVYLLSGSFVFWAWLPFLGFNPMMVYCAFQVCTIYQSWLHTELIRKLHPVFEFIFNTPSHHRVHHGSDLKYLDKNDGAVLIIWDRLFGTFQQEEEKPTYGLTKKNIAPNVYSILTTDWINLFGKVFKSQNILTGLKYLVMAPGWSHDGSSKTVREMRETMKKHRRSAKNCKGDCSVCPMAKKLLLS